MGGWWGPEPEREQAPVPRKSSRFPQRDLTADTGHPTSLSASEKRANSFIYSLRCSVRRNQSWFMNQLEVFPLVLLFLITCQ